MPSLRAPTQRELEVLRLVAHGGFVSEATVKTHVSHLMQKDRSRSKR